MKRLILFTVVPLLAALPARGQDWAKARLEKSPRHQEWVKVKHGDREVQSFIVFPEVKKKATAVVVIHEIFGLSDWVKGVADQLAEAGYIAIAPDLLSGTGKDGGGTSSYAGRNELVRAVSSLPPKQVTDDLNAVTEYVGKLPACNGKVTVGGFCWGGGQTFRFATNNKDIKAAFVFYGSFSHKEEELERINCPVYGFYGGNDARVNSTIPKSTELMQKVNKTYDPVTYDDAGHGFMRAGEDPAGLEVNRKAMKEGWKRWKALLEKI